ncbi:MAG: hypothetical protein M3R45_16465 [Pseudomonadota bacterium]|nr:hypothetical protein [Pseudomonadota bacterium]
MQRALPHIQVGLVQARAGVEDVDALHRRKNFALDIAPLAALDGAEKRRAQNAVGHAAHGFWPERQLRGRCQSALGVFAPDGVQQAACWRLAGLGQEGRRWLALGGPVVLGVAVSTNPGLQTGYFALAVRFFGFERLDLPPQQFHFVLAGGRVFAPFEGNQPGLGRCEFFRNLLGQADEAVFTDDSFIMARLRLVCRIAMRHAHLPFRLAELNSWLQCHFMDSAVR